ncbi:MAG: putative spermidine/putrescine transport system substrate-binding protein [Marivirga sp.]|jgi:putative spermidine/putrescine transport system substrate-binding protein
MLKGFKSLWLLSIILVACESKPQETDLTNITWEAIEQQANSTTVNFMMWQGSPIINNYINNYVVPQVKKLYNIDLKISGGQGPEIVQLVMGEKQAGVSEGQIDMVWINGETFFQLRKIQGLWGPFVDKLPNAEFIDFTDPIISIDFQQPVNGMEAPWGLSQFALVYDSAKVARPPKDLASLEAYLKNNPGTFTLSNDFSGMTLLKSFLAELSGRPAGLNGPFDEVKYEKLSYELWAYLNKNKQYFWKSGTTFPKEHSKMDQLFASGELNLTFGFSEGAIEEKVEQGLFPKSTKGYAWLNGTVRNSNYLGVLENARNKSGAMQVINFLLSPEAQFKKADPAGMNVNTVLDVKKLPQEWQDKFATIAKRKYGPTLKDLAPFAIQEPAPEYMIRLFEDFRTFVIEK